MSFLLKALNARSIEDPRTPITAETLAEATGNFADTGQTVTVNTALKYSPVWRGTMLISESVMKLPVHIYRRVDEGKVRAVEHPSYFRVRYEPNSEQTIEDFKQTITMHAVLKGNGYANIFRLGNGAVDELVMLDPDRVIPVRENGKLLYVYHFPTGEMRKLDAMNVLHIHGASWDGLSGMGIIQYGVHSIGMGMAAQKYSNKFFANGARPSVILEHPALIDEDVAARLKKQWDTMQAGLDNAHKTAVLEQGMKAHVVSMNAKEAQLIENLNFSVRDIANWFGVPPHKLGDNSRTAYNSIEAENQAFLDEALDVWLVSWESEIRKKLLTEDEKRADTHVVEFMRQALLRADMNTRYQAYKIATGGRSFMSPDEVRTRENLNMIGGDAALLKDPQNNFGQPETDASDDDDSSRTVNTDAISKAAHANFQDAVLRMQKRFDRKAAHLKKSGHNETESRRMAWVDESAFITQALTPSAGLVAAVDGEQFEAVLERAKTFITEDD